MDNKPLLWVGNSLDVLRSFDGEARRRIGYELYRLQCGHMPTDFKTLAAVGSGVYEIRVHTRVEHRVVYIAKFEEVVYVLHAFEKRSRKTRSRDIEVARNRLTYVYRHRAGG